MICRLDTSGDGFLTLDEFKDFMQKIVKRFFYDYEAGDYSVFFLKLSIRVGPEMVRQVDINGLGIEIFQKCGLDPTQKISKEQFIEGYMNPILIFFFVLKMKFLL